MVPRESMPQAPTPPPLPQDFDQPVQAPLIEAQRRFAPAGPIGPIMPLPTPPQRKKSYLLPIVVGGSVLIGVIFGVMQVMDYRNDSSVGQVPAPQRKPTGQPRQSIRPSPTPKPGPRALNSTPTVRPQPPRVRQIGNEPAAEIRLSPARRTFPLKQIPTAPLLTPPAQVDNTIYFASRDGDLYSVDATSLELIDQHRVGRDVNRLLLDGSQLKAEPIRGPALTALEFDKPVQMMDPEDVEANGKPTMLGDRPAPPSWFDRQHFYNQVVFYNGKYYQPDQTSIRVLDDGAVSKFASPVAGLSHWKIALLPSGPMGYDNTSVYELDEHLCPIRRIINLQFQPSGRATPNDSFLAGDGKTLCFVQLNDARKRMMIWSLDGKRKIREYPVYLITRGQDDVRPINDWDYRPPTGRLRAVGGGYLFCGRELIWMPAGEGHVIYFRPNEQPPGIIKDPASIRSRYGFLNMTPPAIVGTKIIVGFGGGGIYVFDTRVFASASATSPASRASPTSRPSSAGR